MRALFLVLFVVLCAGSVTKRKVIILGTADPGEDGLLCTDYTDTIEDYRASVYGFAIQSFVKAVLLGNTQFVLSTQAMWITLAAIAEGAEITTQKQLFGLLKLPEDPCTRQIYYKAATTRFTNNENVGLIRKNALIVDNDLKMNEYWREFVSVYGLLEVAKAPIKADPDNVANELRKITSSEARRLNLSGNSVLIETIDYNGLWMTAFNDGNIERSPFYNHTGHHIGFVDLMKTNLKAKIGYAYKLNAKIVGLPIGDRGQYTMYLAQIIGDEDIKSVINKLNVENVFEAILSLKDTEEPINIAIPRVLIQSEVDVKTILEHLGVVSLWSDPTVTSYISDPSALPSSYIQRATLSIDSKGVNPPPDPQLQQHPGPEEDQFFKEFIADGPFSFAIVDTETYSGIISGLYTQPTYDLN